MDSLTLVEHTAEGTLRLLLKHPEVIHPIFLRVRGFRGRADNVSESREGRCWIFLAQVLIEKVPAKKGFKVIPEVQPIPWSQLIQIPLSKPDGELQAFFRRLHGPSLLS